MTATVSISEFNVFAALRALILTLVTCEVVKGIDNGVPMPAQPFIALSPTLMQRLGTNVVTYDNLSDPAAPAWQYQQQPLQYTIQVDCYGPQSNDWAVLIATVLRSEYAATQFAATGLDIAPLYAEDPRQMALVDGEQNFEQRWMVSAVLQYSPVVSLPQDFADQLQVGVWPVDQKFKP